MSLSLPYLVKYWAGNTVLSAKGLLVNRVKFGKEYRRFCSELEESEHYSKEQFRELQNSKLKKLIGHAYENVPYYQALFKQQGIRPDDITCAEDLRKIPLLTKEILKKNAAFFIAKNVNRKLLMDGSTTGSMGSPLNALRSFQSIAYETAIIYRQRRWAGVKPSDRKAAVWGTIWNDKIVDASAKRPPYWRINLAENQLLLSYYHLSENTLPLYLKKLEAFRPSFIVGFPSTLHVLAQFLKKQAAFFPQKAVFTSSEVLYPAHRQLIEERFKTKIFDLYGQAERVIAATECESHEGLHINPEYGILEILKEDGSVGEGGYGEVVGTGLNNLAMPLIRYRTGDISLMSDRACSCGRQMPIMESVEGRTVDIIRTREGKMIPGGGIMAAFHGAQNIRRSQVVQEALDSVTVRIEAEDPGSPLETDALRASLMRCLGKDMHIRFEVVPFISNGKEKFRWMVSKLNRA